LGKGLTTPHCKNQLVTKCYAGIRWEGLDWMYLAQDMDQWQAILNTVMNLWVPYKVGNFLTE